MTIRAQSFADLVATGWTLLASASWQAAYETFESAVAQNPTAEALEGLGFAAWWLNRTDDAFLARQRAFRGYTRTGDRRGAARVAIWLSMDHFTRRGEYAVANGWLRRARRLLDGLESGPEHSLAASWEAHMAIMVERDASRARLLFREAAALAQAHDFVDLHILSMAGEGFARVCEGEIGAGMHLLDEATTAVVSGEVTDPDAMTLSCCYLIYACERVHDLDRAAQWCGKLREIAAAWDYRAMFALCRTHWAGILIAQGKWSEAEGALVEAIDELLATHPAMAAEGIAHLAELRLRQGRYEEASTLLARLDRPPLQAFGKLPAFVTRAHLALEQGDSTGAATMAERTLQILGVGDRLSRAVVLDVLVQARVRLGNIDAAMPALAELQRIAGEVDLPFLGAVTDANEGRVRAASGALTEARVRLEHAVDLFDQSGAPYEAARLRLELAGVCRRLGEFELAELEAGRAHVALSALGVAPTAARRDPSAGPAMPPLTAREREVLRLVARGLSDREMAAALHLSEHTVHRHIANILSKLDLPSRAAAVAYATRNDLI
jgi:ATP/maltotriose-dependent transcriptional regulator MalT